MGHIYTLLNYTKIADWMKEADTHREQINYHSDMVKHYTDKISAEMEKATQSTEGKVMKSLCFDSGCVKRRLTNQ